MKIERKTVGGVTMVALTGELDAANLPVVSERIDALIGNGGGGGGAPPRLVFNLRLLKFINSSALGYLIRTTKRLRELGGEFVISEPSKYFQTTIKTLGIDRIFKVFPNDEEALKYFDEGAADPR